MWNSVCQDCSWTSGALVCWEAADVQRRLHACKHPYHHVELKCVELLQLLGQYRNTPQPGAERNSKNGRNGIAPIEPGHEIAGRNRLVQI